MAFFAIVCHDKPGHLDQRVAIRPEHWAYLDTQKDIIRVAGPLLDDDGQMCGSLFVIEVEDKAAAQAFAASDPFNVKGVFGQVQINGLNRTLGTWS
jgi:uncharacterized protein YciI